MKKPSKSNKIEKAIKRQVSPLRKLSYISPCEKKNILFVYRRHALISWIFIGLLCYIIYQCLIWEDYQYRYDHFLSLGISDYLFYLFDAFFAELLFVFFLCLTIMQLFSPHLVKIVGEKGFAFAAVTRNGTIKGVSILLFETCDKLTIINKGVGSGYKWHFIGNKSSSYQYNYHPFTEKRDFIDAALESWYIFQIINRKTRRN